MVKTNNVLPSACLTGWRSGIVGGSLTSLLTANQPEVFHPQKIKIFRARSHTGYRYPVIR